jgi:hypothetical protein
VLRKIASHEPATLGPARAGGQPGASPRCGRSAPTRRPWRRGRRPSNAE